MSRQDENCPERMMGMRNGKRIWTGGSKKKERQGCTVIGYLVHGVHSEGVGPETVVN